MKINDLRKNLKERSKEDLIKDIIDLFKKNNFVKDYYSIKFNKDSDDSILNKHKDIIRNE